MKKFTLKLFSVGLLALTVISCGKQSKTVTPANTKNQQGSSALLFTPTGVSVSSNGYLVFQNEDVYDSTLNQLATLNESELDAWENSLGYSSLRQALNTETETFQIQTENRSANDDLLRTILNPDGVVQIGGYIFKAEADKGYVTELDAADIQHFDDFNTGTFVTGVTNRFDLDEEDAFDSLATGMRGQNFALRMPLFGTGDKYNDDVYHGTGENEFIWRADTKLSYQKAVFYFSLMGECKLQIKRPNAVFWQGLSGTNNIELKYCDYYWKNKKNNTGSNPAYYQLSSTTANKLNFRPYSGNRALKEFYMRAHFYWQGPNGLRWVPYHFNIQS